MAETKYLRGGAYTLSVDPKVEGQVLTLETAGKYVDKDIVTTINGVSKEVAIEKLGNAVITVGAVTGSTKIDEVAVAGTKGADGYAVTGSGQFVGDATAKVTQEGYAPTTLTGTAEGAVQANVSVNATINAAAATVTGSGQAAQPTLAVEGVDNVLTGEVTNVAPTDGTFYIATKATAPATTLAFTKTVDTKGYLGAIDEITASAKTTPNTYVSYIPVTAGVLSNAAADGTSYKENTADATIIPAEGALYLSEGYYEATKITLAHLIPDPDEDRIAVGVKQMRSGYEAYDKDGKLIVGTMADVELTHTVTADAEAAGVVLGNVSLTRPESGAYITVNGHDSVNTTGTGYITMLGENDSKTKTVYYPVTITDEQAIELIGQGSAEVDEEQSITVTGNATPRFNSTDSVYEITVSGSEEITGSTHRGYIANGKAGSAIVTASGTAKVAAGVISVNEGQSVEVANAENAVVTKNVETGKYELAVAGEATVKASVTTAGYVPANANLGTSTVTAAGKAVIDAGSVSCSGSIADIALADRPAIGDVDTAAFTAPITVPVKTTATHTVTKTAGYIEEGPAAGSAIAEKQNDVSFNIAAYDGSYTLADVTA